MGASGRFVKDNSWRNVAMNPTRNGFSAWQHTFFRADFVGEKAANSSCAAASIEGYGEDQRSGCYAPPALFFFSDWPERDPITQNERQHKMMEHCPDEISLALPGT